MSAHASSGCAGADKRRRSDDQSLSYARSARYSTTQAGAREVSDIAMASRPARGLGGWDNVRFLPNGDIVPPIGDEVLGNVYDVLE